MSGVDDDEFYILDAELTLETGKTGALSFTLPPTNTVYDEIQKLNSIITVYDNDEEIFRGRVLYDEKDFYNRKKISCEGEKAFLLDSVMRPFEFQGSIRDLFTELINNHNNQVEEKKRFEIGEITVKDANDYINRSSSDYDSTYNTLNKKLIETHGGYLKTRVSDGKRVIDYLEEAGEINDQQIEFGTNLLDIKEYISAENIITCLIPLGAKNEETGKRLTIETVNSGRDYLENQTAIDLFGRIYGTQTWDDVTVASNLKTKGQAYLDANIEMSVTLTLKAIDLHLLDINEERIKAGDKVRVISLPHNLDKYFECTKVIIRPLKPDSNEYTFGSTYKTLTDPGSTEEKVATIVQEAVTQVKGETQKEIVEIKGKLTQEEIMNMITNNGEAEGVYLMDGQIWINGTYVDVDTLSAICAKLGTITAGVLKGKCFELNLDRGTVVIGRRNASGVFEETWLLGDENGLTVGGNDGDGGDNQEVQIKIVSTEVTYGVSADITVPTKWYEEIADLPALNEGEYLWTRTVVEYSDGQSTESLTYSRQGVNGIDGVDTTIKSTTPPSNTNNMWLDTSATPHILKYYDGSKWVRANDHTQEINDVDKKAADLDKQIVAWAVDTNKTWINGQKIYTGSVHAEQLAANSVTAEKIAVGSVTADKIATKSISSDKIDVAELFAQQIESTGSIKGVKFISENEYGQGVVMDEGSISFNCVDELDAFKHDFNYFGLDLNYQYKGTADNAVKKSRLLLLPYRLLLSGSGKDGITNNVIEADIASNIVKISNLTIAKALKVGSKNVALEDHTHNYAPATHYHDYAPTTHTHDYAAKNHEHPYMPANPTAIDSQNDALNINGVIVTKGSRITAATIWKGNSNYPVYGCRALYANASGTTGTVTLSESAENFKYLIIVVGFSDTGASGTVVVWSPNGKIVDVGAITAEASNANVARVRYAISGTTLTASANYTGKVSSGSYSATQNKVYCKAVLGFK